jgi:hypothetical protein
MLTGYMAVQLTVSSASHNYATFSGSSDGSMVSSDTGEFKILWKETGTGEKWAVVFLGAGGIPERSRYFKVTDASNEVDGLQVKVAFGRCRVADKYFAVPAITEENDYTIKGITTSGYLYFQSVVDETNEAQQPTIEFSENMYGYESGYCKHLLAIVNLNDGADAIASIEQQDDGYIVDEIYGTCDEEEA